MRYKIALIFFVGFLVFGFSSNKPSIKYDGMIGYKIDSIGNICVVHNFDESKMSATQGMLLIEEYINSYRRVDTVANRVKVIKM